MSADERSIQTDVKTNAQHLEQDVDVAKVVHADGTVDYIDARAVGGDFEEMPKGYFYSPQFIGTVAVSYMISRSFLNRLANLPRHKCWPVFARTWAGCYQQTHSA